MIENQFSATKALLPNDVDPLAEQPRNKGTKRNKKV